MSVTVRLFGFGEVRPHLFQGRDHAHIEIKTPASPARLMDHLGLAQTDGLVLLQRGHPVPRSDWEEMSIRDGDSLTLMWAIEGG